MKRICFDLKVLPKRDPNIITPCCNKSNKNLKFINYFGLPKHFGYCFSCAKATLPPPIYEDDKGVMWIFNKGQNKYELLITYELTKNVSLTQKNVSKSFQQMFIHKEIIEGYYKKEPENNLLKYLRKTYGNAKTNNVKERYIIGTYNDGATVFCEINKNLKVQKCKLSYYKINGRRTNRFNHLYKNENGYLSCLFGEHLIIDELKGFQTLILVESEKTAIVGDILLPKYTWLAYGGRHNLTIQKYKCLKGHKLLIVPDMENQSVKVIKDKIIELRKNGVNANLWDMTKGRSDEQLKNDGVYGNDLEDVFREMKNVEKTSS